MTVHLPLLLACLLSMYFFGGIFNLQRNSLIFFLFCFSEIVKVYKTQNVYSEVSIVPLKAIFT